MCYQQDRNRRKTRCSSIVVKEWAYSNSLSALPRRRGLKQHWRTELKSSVWEQQWHPRMLGNAIQALERSIVRITFVRGKRKLGCTITNCFQILSFSRSKLLPKLSADTDTILAESYISLWSAEWVGTLLNLKHGYLSCQVTDFLYVACVKSVLLWGFIAHEVKEWFLIAGKLPNISNKWPNFPSVLAYGFCTGC